jgi:hypothetical protein
MTEDELTPWQRAGIPHPQWHQVLSFAIRQRIDADVALRDFYAQPEPITDAWLAQRRRLLARVEWMQERYRITSATICPTKPLCRTVAIQCSSE